MPPETTTQSASPSEVDRQFRTEHLRANLKGRSVRGGIVTLAAQAIKFTLQLGSTAVLARLLTPIDFGLVAMVSALTGFMWLFSDMGLSAVTVQRAQLVQSEVSALFWINVGLGVILAALGTALGPVLSWFYAEPRLTSVTIAISSTFILGGLTSQHYALLVRQMRFGAAAFVLSASFGVGVAVAITLASCGLGYWSLVWMIVANSFAALVLSWLLSGWRPSLPARSANLKAMLNFGGALTCGSLLTYAVRNADNVIVGRFRGANALGLYSKAYGLVLLPVQQLSSPLSGVLVPVLSRLQSEPERFRRYFLCAVGLLALVGMPLISFVFADARAFVLTLLGPNWIGAVPLFRLLAAGAFVGIITGASDWVLISLGQANRLLQWYVVSAPLTVLSFLVGIRWGATGVASAFSIISCVLATPMFWWALRASPIRFEDVASALWRPAIASTLASKILLSFIYFVGLRVLPALELAIDSLVLLSIYTIILIILPGGRAFIGRTVSVLSMRSAPTTS